MDGRAGIMDTGFFVKKLTLTGTDVPDASLDFCVGLNVVTGPSDTGKTFIAQCLAYILGAGTEPKDIPERASYDTVHLEIEARRSHETICLERSLRGGDVLINVPGAEPFVVKPSHQSGDEHTLSYFLTDLCNLAGARVRTNQRGTTRELSFRDLRLLTVIDEEKVISERSPVLTGQYTSKTVETSVFRLLLSGIDDGSIIEREQTGAARARRTVKLEVLNQMADDLRRQLTVSFPAAVTEDGLQSQLDLMDQDFDSIQDRLSATETSFEEVQRQRTEVLNHLRAMESRIAVLQELESRFSLLEQQYGSDLGRLECVAETVTRLSEMPEARCPVCGALPEHAENPHRCIDASPETVILACKAEIEKITGLTGDLAETRDALSSESEALVASRHDIVVQLKELDLSVKDHRQQVSHAMQQLREQQGVRENVLKALSMYQRLKELDETIASIEAEVPATNQATFSNDLSGSLLNEFSMEIEQMLQRWQMPGNPRIAFDESTLDITMNGVARISHGKGVRAITHAAFVLSLMNYCRNKSMPHSGTVIIDSPLVVYRDPDPEEGEMATSVKDSFYRALTEDLGSCQAIILENEDPPEDVVQAANVVAFTASEDGRRGFIPIDNSNDEVSS